MEGYEQVANQDYQYNQNNQENQNYQNYQAPALQLVTDRTLLKYILLSLVTFGIYALVVNSKFSMNLNLIASRYDGKRTMHYLPAVILGAYSAGIYLLIWNHQYANRIGDELARRGFDYEFDASTFWIWGVLGSFIIVGPYIYAYRLIKSMNMLNESYNQFG